MKESDNTLSPYIKVILRHFLCLPNENFQCLKGNFAILLQCLRQRGRNSPSRSLENVFFFATKHLAVTFAVVRKMNALKAVKGAVSPILVFPALSGQKTYFNRWNR